MNNRRCTLLAFFFVLAAMALSAGCGHSYMVVRQAMPNPFRGATFSLMPLDTAMLQIDGMPAAMWFASNAGDAASVQHDIQQAFTDEFAPEVRDRSNGALVPQGGQYGVLVRMVSWTRGHYTGNNYNVRPTYLTLNVSIVNAGGQVFDEIQVQREFRHSIFQPVPVIGLNNTMEDSGEIVGDYLKERRTTMFLRHRRHVAQGVVASPAL